MLFSEKIKQLRLESGKRQKDLAKAIGVDVPAYSRYEHGERRPKREQVLRLARIFKTDADVKLLYEMVNTEHPEGSESTKSDENANRPAPVTRGLVTHMGRSALPHYEQGDAATVMQRIEDESIDCIVTTPPYWRRRSQGTESITATTKEEFVAELLQTMAQAWRVLKPQGSLWLNMGDDTTDGFVQGIPWRVVLQMIDRQGWQLVNEVVWNKTTTSPQGSQDHLRKVHEFMFHLVKNDDFYYNDEELRRTFALIMRNEVKGKGKPTTRGKQHQGLVPSDVWTIGVQRSGIAHYCVAPDTLYRLPLVATCPHDGIVLDPYCGTGTACKIAYEMNLRSIGIDINGEYIRQARATTEVKPLSLF